MSGVLSPVSRCQCTIRTKRHYDHLEGTSVWSDDSLSPLDKALLIPNDIANFDDVACDIVVQDLDRLAYGNSTRKQLDHVARFEDDIGVIGFASGSHRHGTMNEIKLA